MGDFRNLIDRHYYGYKRTLYNIDNEFAPQGQFGFQQSRIFQDKVTGCFVDTFLSDYDIEKRYKFIKFCSEKIKAEIYLNINEKLINDRFLPLKTDEKIHVLFKGGNIMNHLYNEIFNHNINDVHLNHSIDNIREYFRNINPIYNDTYIKNNNNGPNDLRNYINDISKSFGISDVDFSIYIDVKDPKRFEIIYDYVIKITGKTLQDISIYFNNILLNNFIPFPVIINNNIFDFNNIEIDRINRIYLDFQNQINNYFNHNDLRINAEFNIFLINIIANLNEYNNFYDNLDILYKLLIMCENCIYLYDKNIINRPVIRQELINIKNEIHLKISQIPLRQINDLHDFFIIDKPNLILNPIPLAPNIANIRDINKINSFTHFLNSICNEINNIVDNNRVPIIGQQRFEADLRNKFEQNFKAVILTNRLEINDLKLQSRNNAIIYNVSDPKQITNIEEDASVNNYFYITYNNVIKKIRNDGTSTTNFDLMRIKFNLVIQNNKITVDDNPKEYAIPSEFLDISIPRYDDNTRIKVINDINQHGHIGNITRDITGNIYSIDSYSLDDTIEDLYNVLFIQNIDFPWADIKYDKRIKRLIILLFLKVIITNDVSIIHKLLYFTKTLITTNIQDNDPNSNTVLSDKFIEYLFLQRDQNNLLTIIPNVDCDYIKKYTNMLLHEYIFNLINYDNNNKIIIHNDFNNINHLVITNVKWHCYNYLRKNNQLPELINIINKSRRRYLWNDVNLIDINEMFNKYNSFIQILVDTIIKVTFIFIQYNNDQLNEQLFIDTINPNYFIIPIIQQLCNPRPIIGGSYNIISRSNNINDNYYKNKYLKYKSKYISIKKDN